MRAAFAAALVAFVACSRQPEPEATPTATATASATTTPTATASASASPSDPALTQFCTDAYGADLDALRKKCSADEMAAPEGLARTAAKLCTRDLTTLLGNHRAKLDPAAAAQCIAAVKIVPEKKPLEGETFFARPPCDRVTVGSQAEGQPCRWPPECKDGLACDGYKVGVEGTCKKPAAIGVKCSAQLFGGVFNELALAAHHGPCVKGAYCDNATCVARGAVGAPCARSTTCGDGLVCTMSKCAKGLAAAGGACSRTADCVSDLYCDTGAGKCAAKKSAGAECASDECKGWCDVPKGAKTGKCASSCGSG